MSVGVALETDAAQGVVLSRTIAPSVATETDSALVPGFYEWTGADFLGPDWVVLDRTSDSAIPPAGNGEMAGYEPSQVFINGSGNLEILAENRDSVHDGATPGVKQPYVAGMLQWAPGLTFVHGTLEFRMKVPSAAGTWKGIWLLGVNQQIPNITTAENGGTANWPFVASLCDEIDIAEVFSDGTVNCQVHADFGSGHEAPGGPISLGFSPSAAFFSGKFERAPGSLVFSFRQLDTDPWVVKQTITTSVSSTPMFVLINCTLGGTAGGTVDEGALPDSLEFEYLRLTRDS